MKYCISCNKYYEDGDRYCFKCNRPLEWVDDKLVKKEVYNTISRRKETLARAKSIYKPPVYTQKKETYTPKCPTCGCPHIHKVTTSERAGNIALFGLLGNKRRMQFKCKNCGYMW